MKKFIIILSLVVAFVSNSQETAQQDTTQVQQPVETLTNENVTLNLGEGGTIITVEPVAPVIEIARKRVNPKKYTFFRNFKSELTYIPKNFYKIKKDQKDEIKVKDLSKMLSVERK